MREWESERERLRIIKRVNNKKSLWEKEKERDRDRDEWDGDRTDRERKERKR